MLVSKDPPGVLVDPDLLLRQAQSRLIWTTNLRPEETDHRPATVRQTGLSSTFLRACRKVHDEALPILYSKNLFIFKGIVQLKHFRSSGLSRVPSEYSFHPSISRPQRFQGVGYETASDNSDVCFAPLDKDAPSPEAKQMILELRQMLHRHHTRPYIDEREFLAGTTTFNGRPEPQGRLTMIRMLSLKPRPMSARDRSNQSVLRQQTLADWCHFFRQSPFDTFTDYICFPNLQILKLDFSNFFLEENEQLGVCWGSPVLFVKCSDQRMQGLISGK